MDSEDGTLGSISAVNIADSINRMSKNDAEELLDKFQHDKWIDKVLVTLFPSFMAILVGLVIVNKIRIYKAKVISRQHISMQKYW